MRTAPSTRRIWGSINTAGGVQVPGSADWTVVKTGTGAFLIHFPAMRALASVSATTTAGAILATGWPAADSLAVNTYNTSLAAYDAGFNFAIEGRPL